MREIKHRDFPRHCCKNVATGKGDRKQSFRSEAEPIKSCDKLAKYWYLHNDDICSYCVEHNYVCGYKLIITETQNGTVLVRKAS